MNTEYSKKWSFVVFLLMLLLIFTYLGDALFSINTWVYGVWGDGIKNYYHVLAAAKYSEALWLPTVNYPFGENLFFLDAQPLIAKFLQLFGLENYSVGFVNGLPIFSLSIAAVFVFLIQRELKLPLVLNIITSIIISLLSPQIARMTGHFGLGYACYLPILIYLLFKVKQKPKLSYSLIALVITVFSFLHLYFLLIGLVLVVSFFVYHLVKKDYLLAVFNIVAVLVPFLIVKTTLYLSDPILDRPESPFGIWAYRATFSGVFNPPFKPLNQILRAFINYPGPTFESSAYVGILGLPMLLFAIYFIFKAIYKKQNIISRFQSSEFMYMFFAAFLIWFIALYYPLKVIIDPALELLPPLKQFRSLGRFSWILYYVFSIFISLQLWHLFQFIKNKKLATFVLATLLILWLIDANANMNTLKERISERMSFSFEEVQLSKKMQVALNQNNFDAILALPLFHVGSEIDNNLTGSSFSLLETFKVSNLYNIPYVSTFSSRVSTSQFYKVKKVMDTGILNELVPIQNKILIIADYKSLSATDSILLSKAIVLDTLDRLVYATYTVE